jgi:hypothetical protein
VFQPPENPTLHLLGSLMAKMDRGDALGEARFAAMETVVSLMRAGDGYAGEGNSESLELLRQALASARATVVAAAYALTTSADATRMKMPVSEKC